MRRFGDLLLWLEGALTEEEADALWEEAATQYIDPQKVDLVHEYQKLNKLLFDGKLGVYPMRWNNRKRSGALVSYRRMGPKVAKSGSRLYRALHAAGSQLPELKIIDIQVSKFMSINEQALKNRLAHEMIHVYWLEKGVEYGHDEHFKSEMRRINRMNVGIKVDTTESTQDPNVKLHRKEYAVLLGIDSGKARNIMVVPIQNVDKMIGFMTYYLGNYRDVVSSYDVYTHDVEWLNTYPQSRIPNLGRKPPTRYRVKPEDAQEIQGKGTYLGSVTKDGFSKSKSSSVVKAVEKPKEPEKFLVFVQRTGRVADGVFVAKDNIRPILSSMIGALMQGAIDSKQIRPDTTWEVFLSDADWVQKKTKLISSIGNLIPNVERVHPLELKDLYNGEYKGILKANGTWSPGGKPQF